MSTTVMSGEMMLPVTEPAPATEVEFATCECCGLTEECTPEYIERIRERYLGNWICGLCGEAVKDEIVRSKRLISSEEAMARHVSFCRASISSVGSVDASVCLIATVRQILRRSLDSMTEVRSVPCSPTTVRSDGAGVKRSESCIPNVTLVVGSSMCGESEEDSE